MKMSGFEMLTNITATNLKKNYGFKMKGKQGFTATNFKKKGFKLKMNVFTTTNEKKNWF